MTALLAPLPPTFASTRLSLHMLAEQVVCVARYQHEGRVRLTNTPNGFATPPFGPDGRIVGVTGVELVDGPRSTPITTVREAAAFVGVEPGAPGSLWTPVAPFAADNKLAVDPHAAQLLADWYGFVESALGGFAARAGAEIEPLTLWPEGFDLATATNSANYGGSAGDGSIDEPYLYVGPHARPYPAASPPFWNASFGASLRYGEIDSLEDAVAFFARGFALMHRDA